MKLRGRLALITGGGRGIGRAIAISFAREGADVAVIARTQTEVAEVASEVADRYAVKSFFAVCDVSKSESVQQAISEVGEYFGRDPEILVNNAGVAESSSFARTSDDLWNRIMGVNLNGPFYCTRSVLPSMIERGWGRIINIASIAGKTGAAYIG